MLGCALGALYADLLRFSYLANRMRTAFGVISNYWPGTIRRFSDSKLHVTIVIYRKQLMSSRKCLLLNYSLVSIFIFPGRGGKSVRGKKVLSQNQCTDGQVHFPFGRSRLKLVTITLVSFPRSSHLQPMCKTPYTTWATLIRQWQQHHTPVKQWHKQTNQKKALLRTHKQTHTHTDLMERAMVENS